MGKGRKVFEDVQREAMAALLDGSLAKRPRKMSAETIAKREATKRRKYEARKREAVIPPIDKRYQGSGSRPELIAALAGGAWRTKPEIDEAVKAASGSVAGNIQAFERWGLIERRANPDYDPETGGRWSRMGRRGARELCEFEFRLVMSAEAASWFVR